MYVYIYMTHIFNNTWQLSDNIHMFYICKNYDDNQYKDYFLCILCIPFAHIA